MSVLIDELRDGLDAADMALDDMRTRLNASERARQLTADHWTAARDRGSAGDDLLRQALHATGVSDELAEDIRSHLAVIGSVPA